MFNTLRSIAASLCAAALLLPAAAQASPTCDLGASNSCPEFDQVETYQMECPRGSGKRSCPYIEAPPPAELHCDSAGGGVMCEAWPQSDQLTYRYVWSVIQGVAPDYSAYEFSPQLFGNCTGLIGKVTVTVIAPNGHATSMQSRFSCENGQ